MLFIMNIILRSFGRIPERGIGLQHEVETEPVTGVRIVRMVTLCKITKHPFQRSRIGIRANFQDFVVVDEFKCFHYAPPSGLSRHILARYPLDCLPLTYRYLARMSVQQK